MPADAVTQRYLSEREKLVTRVEGIKTTSIEQKRDLSDQDKQALAACSARIKELDELIDLVSFDTAMDQQVADRIRKVGEAADSQPTVYRSAGELLWDVLHQSEREAQRRYDTYTKRAAQHMGTKAENTVAVAGGFGGLVVSPVYGPIIDLTPGGRPFLDALGVRPAPDSLSFMRPRIVDPDLDTGVAPQAKEKQELASKKFDIKNDPLQLTTTGGYLNVSQQLQSLVANSLDVILGQLNKRLARSTEKAGLVELAKSTAKVPLAAGASGEELNQAIYDASALVYETTGELAQWIAMGPKGWARLGGATNSAGQLMFPFIGAANAMGNGDASTFAWTSVAGLSPVVTYGIADDTFWVGNGSALEAYEYRYPVLEAVEPSLLGRQVAVASSLVFYRPTTAEDTGTGAAGDGAVHIAP